MGKRIEPVRNNNPLLIEQPTGQAMLWSPIGDSNGNDDVLQQMFTLR